MKAYIFTALIILLSAQSAHSALTTITCEYDTFASVQKVEPAIEVMQMTFTVDTETSDAKVIRKSGITDVEIYPTGGGFTFVEINKRGNVLTTTVDIHGKSAHSRNTIIDTDLIPSQFYGSCDYER
ncbi:MAG: hypothetical protein AAF304_06645 [Pseudomonadota bacterium]